MNKTNKTMKGVSYITDDRNHKHSVVIDLKLFKQHGQDIDDMLDIIIAEARKDERSIPFDKVVKSLKQKGKL